MAEGRALTLEILYFAWLRERIGAPRESVETSAATAYTTMMMEGGIMMPSVPAVARLPIAVRSS